MDSGNKNAHSLNLKRFYDIIKVERKNNEWKSVQELKLSTYIRTQGNWNDVGTEQVATIGQVNKGQTRRRQGGEWKQERPFA